MAYYTFTSADISAIAAAGVTATFNGNTLKANDTYGAGAVGTETLVFTCGAGKKFNTVGGLTSINFQNDKGEKFNFTLTSGDTVATYNKELPSGSQPWAPPTYSFAIATVSAAKVMYTFTSNDITALTTNGTTGTINGANVVTGSTVKVGDTVVFKAANGKRFKILNSTVQLFFRNGAETKYFTLNSDQTVGTFETPDTDVFTYFRANVEDKPAEAPFYTFTTADITKASTNHFKIYKNGVAVVNGDKLLIGDVVKVTADTGWKFKTNTAATILTGIYFLGSVDNWFFTPDSDAHNGSFTVPTWNTANTVAFTVDTGSVIVDNVPTPLNWGTHPTTGVVGTAVNFTWSGGDISVSPNAYNVVVTDGSTIVDDITTATPAYTLAAQSSPRTLTVTVYDKGGKNDSTASNIVSSIAIAAAPKKIKYTITAADITMLSNEHCVMTNNGQAVKAGDNIRVDDSLIITAVDNYAFASAPYFAWTSNAVFFNLDASKKIATMIMADSNYTYNQFSVATLLPSTGTLGGNNVYLVDNDKLKEVTKNRFDFISNTQGDTFIDYGNYILSVLELPFTVDSAYIIGSETVKLATKDTGVSANKLSVDIVPMDLGVITVPAVTNDLRDFDNTTAILYLPRSQPINIDIEYVVGQTIGVVYLVDMYSGKATINITSTKTGKVIIQKIVDMGVDVPYAGGTSGIENTQIELAGDNKVTKPYITIVRSDAPLINGVFTIPITDEQLLSTQTGFIQVENIDLNSHAIKSEKEDLINILNAGVIIK